MERRRTVLRWRGGGGGGGYRGTELTRGGGPGGKGKRGVGGGGVGEREKLTGSGGHAATSAVATRAEAGLVVTGTGVGVVLTGAASTVTRSVRPCGTQRVTLTVNNSNHQLSHWAAGNKQLQLENTQRILPLATVRTNSATYTQVPLATIQNNSAMYTSAGNSTDQQCNVQFRWQQYRTTAQRNFRWQQYRTTV